MNDIAYLLKVSIDSDDIGNRIETLSQSKKVYGQKKDIKSYEYYNALSVNNMKLSFAFEMWENHYDDEELLKYNDEIYTVVRALYNKKDKVSLLVQKRVD